MTEIDARITGVRNCCNGEFIFSYDGECVGDDTNNLLLIRRTYVVLVIYTTEYYLFYSNVIYENWYSHYTLKEKNKT